MSRRQEEGVHKAAVGRRSCTAASEGRASPRSRRWPVGMGRRRVVLPPELPEHGFTLSRARASGVSGRLRTGFETPSRGVRVRPGEGGPPTVLELASLLVEALPPDAVLSHDTAARLHDLPAPRRWSIEEPIHVTRATGRPPIERRGVVSHAGLEAREVVTVHDLPVTSVLDTWSDLAPTWSRRRLFAAGDVLLRDHRIERGRVVAHVESLTGRRGVCVLRELAPLLDAGSASPKESEARLLFIDNGLPVPQLNVSVRDDWGRQIGIADFVWWEQRVIGEYDGDQHRTDRSVWQYERDRRAQFEAAGWTYVEMTNIHLVREAYTHRLISRLRDLLL